VPDDDDWDRVVEGGLTRGRDRSPPPR
jgi:hypothetical protein